MDNIQIGPFLFTWTGSALTITGPGGGPQPIPAEDGYNLLVWLHDDMRQNLYRAAHPAQPGSYEEGKE